MNRNDPLTAGRYRIELGDMGDAVFLECSGLKNSTEVVEYWEGGENRDVHKFQGSTKFSNIVLKHGFGRFSSDLRRWRDAVVNGKPPMFFDGAIVLLNDEGKEAVRWSFSDGYFCQWEGPELKGGPGALAIETLEIACKVWSFKTDDNRYKPPVPPTPEPPENITAIFTPMRAQIFEGEEVKFKDRSVCSKSIKSWEWSSPTNDGWTATEQHPKSKFDKPGAHRVKLKVTSEGGKTDTATGTVTVKKDGIKADFIADPDTILQGEEVLFKDRSISTNTISTWTWSCPGNEGWTASEQHPSATFKQPGVFDVELKVTSSTSKDDTTKRKVTVKAEEVKAEFEFNSDAVQDGKLDKFKFIPFKVNSSDLTTEAVSLLNEAVKLFKDNPGLKVDLKGWASKEGEESYNLKLSDRRAKSVQKYMSDHGVGAGQIVEAKGYGETEQFAAGNAEAQLKENRRVEWVLRPDSVVTLKIRVGDKVQFTDRSRTNTSISKWEWDCSAAQWQGANTDQNPVATFSEAGTHSVTLQVTGIAGASDSVTHTIEIAPSTSV